MPQTKLASTLGDRSVAEGIVAECYARAGHTKDFGIPPHAVTFIANDNGDAVGTVSLEIDPPQAKVIRLAIADRAEGKAILRSMLDAMAAYGQFHPDVTTLSIEVSPPHSRFYSRMGFLKAGVGSTAAPDGFVLMKLELAKRITI